MLAERTRPFNEGDITHFFPLMAQVEARLGRRPRFGTWAVLLGLADLSEAAWRKRLRRSASWLGWLLSALLMANPDTPPPTRRRVRLIDAARLGQVGRGGDAWRVHWDDDLTAGRLGQVVVTDQSGGEHLERFALAPDDIIVADNGYGYQGCRRGGARPGRHRAARRDSRPRRDRGAGRCRADLCGRAGGVWTCR